MIFGNTALHGEPRLVVGPYSVRNELDDDDYLDCRMAVRNKNAIKNGKRCL